MANCGLLIDYFKVLWKSDLPLTVIFPFAALSQAASWRAFLNFCGACHLGTYLRARSAWAVLDTLTSAFADQFAFLYLISLVINTNCIRARVSFEPALIGHCFASNKWFVLARKADVSLVLFSWSNWFSLGHNPWALAVDVYCLKLVGLARHNDFWAAWFMSEVFTLLVQWT